MKRFATSLAVATLALTVGCSDDDSGSSGICGQIDALLTACGLATSLNYGCPEPATEYENCVSDCLLQLACDELILGEYCGEFLPGQACYDACDALEFTCSDASTIPASAVCDFVDDCSDGERIPVTEQCDGFPDCTGGGDETGCPARAIIGCYGQQRATPPSTILIPPSTQNPEPWTAIDIAAGGYHSCAVQESDGITVCWGNNDRGQANPPASVDDPDVGTATDVATGDDHSCAIQAGTGIVFCWGEDDDGQSTPPDAVNGVSGNATDISAGGYHSCAVQAGTGSVLCWGDNQQGQAAPPDAVNGVSGSATDIVAGGYHSCAIQADTGDAVCWGNDGVTIPLRWMCDNVEHCPDGSDEGGRCWYLDACS